MLAFLLLLAATPDDFVQRLYPVFERAQCRLCHSDNGVASTSRLQFPRPDAPPEEIRKFGLRLAALVDRSRPEESLLWRKPTNRTAHPGGERIRQGSEDERLLRGWVEALRRMPVPPAAELAPQLKPAKTALRRLTHSEYNHIIAALLGDESRPADRFPKEDFIHGFVNQVEGQSISPLQAEAYGRAAERLARNAFRGGDTRRLIPCTPSRECRAAFIRSFGGRAFRRPLTGDEVHRYAQLFDLETGSFLDGARLVVETILQSPHFLFHLEPGPYYTASRLSCFLWDTMPDEELLRAAAAGELAQKAGIEKQVRRMLADNRARRSMDEFLAQWLRFDRLRAAIRDRRLFPEFSDELTGAMIEETRRFFRALVWEDGNFLDFYNGRYSYLSAELARLYNLTPPAQQWDRVEFPAGFPRAGIVGQATFLALTSKPDETSPTERGLFVREHFLCQSVPPPPPGVNATLPPVTDEKPLSNPARLEMHLTNAGCAGCHQLVDPIGFGLERFDAIGKERAKQVVTIYPTFDEMKQRIKTKPTSYAFDIASRGAILGVKNSGFGSPRELGDILAAEPACRKCVVRQLFRFAVGRMEEEGDQPAIDGLLRRFEASQFRFRELIIAVATSDPFLEGKD
jgi:hypothetical protein